MSKLKDDSGLIEELGLFGLDPETARLYLLLLKEGPLGVVAIAKLGSVGRNVAYRLLSNLAEKQLVSVASKSFGKEYTALGGPIFEGMITSHEAKVSTMKGTLDTLVNGLSLLAGNRHEAKIIHYEGVNGLKQVNWNLTRAKKEFRVFELSPLAVYLDQDFSEKLRRIWVQNKITTYDITNHKAMDLYTADVDYWRTYSKYRYIDPKVLEIKYEMYIYNDVVALLDYQASKPHCVEIYDQSLADMQKQLYEAIWAQGKEMPINSETQRREVKGA